MYKKMIDKLKEKGYKLTPQRIEIIKILGENTGTHPFLEEIYKIVKNRLITVSFSTLYNTITTLEEIGLIKLFNFQNETRIELNPDIHINIINQNTGKIVDITDDELIKEIMQKLKYNKKEHKHILINVIFY
jgi:Fur family peroxide stress response transcriptional regulator